MERRQLALPPERNLQTLPKRAVHALGSHAASLLVEKFGMGVYSNRQIFEAYENEHIVIDPFNPKHVNGSSYDVLLGQYFYHSGYTPDKVSEDKQQETVEFFNGFDEASTMAHFGTVMEGTPLREHRSVLERLDPQVYDEEGNEVALKNLSADQDIIILRPGERILAHTHEFIGIRAPGTTSMQARSTIGRLGIVVCMDAGWGDPGYINRWTMEIKNHNEQYTVVPIGIRIAQIVFRHTGPVDGEYSNLSGKYQTSSSHDLDHIKANWQPSDMLPKAYKDTIEPLPPVQGLRKGLR